MKRLLIALTAAALLVCGTASALASQFGGSLPEINLYGQKLHVR